MDQEKNNSNNEQKHKNKNEQDQKAIAQFSFDFSYKNHHKNVRYAKQPKLIQYIPNAQRQESNSNSTSEASNSTAITQSTSTSSSSSTPVTTSPLPKPIASSSNLHRNNLSQVVVSDLQDLHLQKDLERPITSSAFYKFKLDGTHQASSSQHIKQPKVSSKIPRKGTLEYILNEKNVPEKLLQFDPGTLFG